MKTQTCPKPEKPTDALVSKYLSAYNHDAHYSHEDALQHKIVKGFAGSYEDVLLVVVVINQLYSTNLYNVYKMADYIHEKIEVIWPAIRAGEVDAVKMIATGHGIGRLGSKESVMYSFASKFCNYLNPDAYPIFDSYIEKLLKIYNKEYGFYPAKGKDIRDYATFKEWVQAFVDYFHLSFTLREIDKFLWYYGSKELKL